MTYKVLNSKCMLKTKVFEVVADTVELPSGNVKDRFIVRHPGAVVILPVQNNGKLVAIKQYRHSIAQTILEFPAGTLDDCEEPMNCAMRELKEEIGFGAADWTPLGELYPAPGFCDERQFLYLASNLTADKLEGDEDEVIEVVELSTAEVEQAVVSGEMRDGKSLAVFLRARLAGLV